MPSTIRSRWTLAVRIFLMALVPICGFAQQPAAMPFELAKPGLDVGIVVSDMEKARKFYGEGFGLKQLPELPFALPGGGQMVRYQAGATVIKLRTYPKTPPAVEPGALAVNGIRLLALFIADADGVSARLVRLGFKAPEFGPVQRGEFRFGFTQDPDGNQIEVVTFGQNPPPGIYERIQIGLTVSDAEKAREFYGKVLGLSERPAVQLPATIAADTMQYSFVAGVSTIKFSAPKTARPTRSGPIGAAIGIRYITFIVKDVDAAYRALKSRGVPIVTEPMNLGTTARLFIAADPDGNAIEFAGAIPQ